MTKAPQGAFETADKVHCYKKVRTKV